MAATWLVFGITFFKSASMGDGGSRKSCHLEKIKKWDLLRHKT